MRRLTDISGSRMNEFPGIAKPSAMGLLLSWTQPRAQRGHPGMLPPGHADKGHPSHPHQTMPPSTRTSIDSPGVMTSVGYIRISARVPAVFGSSCQNLSSYPGPDSLRETSDQAAWRVTERVNVPSPVDVAVFVGFGPAPVGRGAPGE